MTVDDFGADSTPAGATSSATSGTVDEARDAHGTSRPVFTVRYRRDPEDDAWLVECVEDPGAHTYGRTLRQARRRAPEAVAAWFDLDEDAFVLHERFNLDEPVRARLESYLTARDRSAELAERAARAQRSAVAALTGSRPQGAGLSQRDAAELLGLSHQRVAQLAAETVDARGGTG